MGAQTAFGRIITSVAGGPDWAKFRLLGARLLRVVFWKLKKYVCRANFLGYFSAAQGYELITTKRGLGYILGDFFTNSSVTRAWSRFYE
jgi:hypothetical protein